MGPLFGRVRCPHIGLRGGVDPVVRPTPWVGVLVPQTDTPPTVPHLGWADDLRSVAVAVGVAVAGTALALALALQPVGGRTGGGSRRSELANTGWRSSDTRVPPSRGPGVCVDRNWGGCCRPGPTATLGGAHLRWRVCHCPGVGVYHVDALPFVATGLLFMVASYRPQRAAVLGLCVVGRSRPIRRTPADPGLIVAAGPIRAGPRASLAVPVAGCQFRSY